MKAHKLEKGVEDLLNSLKHQPDNPFTAMVSSQATCRRECRAARARVHARALDRQAVAQHARASAASAADDYAG